MLVAKGPAAAALPSVAAPGIQLILCVREIGQLKVASARENPGWPGHACPICKGPLLPLGGPAHKPTSGGKTVGGGQQGKQEGRRVLEAQRKFVDPRAARLMTRFVLIELRKLRKLTRGVQEKWSTLRGSTSSSKSILSACFVLDNGDRDGEKKKTISTLRLLSVVRLRKPRSNYTRRGGFCTHRHLMRVWMRVA